jgi:hypothetical protein
MTIYDFGVGGYDIEFDVASISVGQEIIVCSGVGINADSDDPDTAKSFIVIGRDSTGYYLEARDKDGDSIEEFESEMSNLGRIRVLFHNAFCTVYFDYNWVYTFYFYDVYHPEEPEVGLKTVGGSITVYNIRLKELADWREAIYVNMETSTQNAISTAILQRPVDMYPNWQGQLVFEYDPTRESDEVFIVKSHSVVETNHSKASSDGIVESVYSGVVMDLALAETDGFVTRMYSLPDLDNGFIRAASIIQTRARRSQYGHRVACRINVQFEIGDIAEIDEAVSGTGTSVIGNFVIENITLAISEGRQEMTLSGRDSDA